ncbi:MAG TPA: sigma-70 family RNA polymerase sigma factor [Prosthecobacter sp.]
MKTITPNTFSSVTSTEPAEVQLPTDEDLMISIQQRDGEALKILVQRYRKLLKCAILRTVHDDAAAEDVLQECLLDLWRHSDHYSAAKGKPLAWMMTLCRRRAIDYLRRSMAYCRAKDRMEESMKETVSYTQDCSLDCEQADMGRVLGQHLALLPPAQQEVIRLAFLKGMSQREVAHATHTPLGTVKTRLELGLKKLRQVFRTRSAIHTLQAA